MMLSFHIITNNQDASIIFNGDLDIEATEILEDEIIPSMVAYENVDIDLSGVPFVDSTGIGLLINLIETIKSKWGNVQIIIKHIQPLVKEVFEMLQLNEIFGEKVTLLE
jgi:anti-anti-sigma factor